MATDAMIEAGARAISPYAWERKMFVDANGWVWTKHQEHLQESARRDARACLEAALSCR